MEIMDQKTWLWRKRSTEKTIVANGGEAQSVIPIKKEVDLESCLKSLNEKLDSVLDECSAKDRLVESCKKTADDAMADKARSEEELHRLRRELDAVLQQRDAANERLSHLNSALKDSMDQLHAVRGDQEERLRDAAAKASQESRIGHRTLEEKLASANAESSYLGKALLVKEKLIEELNLVKSQREAEFEALMNRLDSTEKENAFLRYEFRTLEKEHDLRNEELEYCSWLSEASHKQHLESVKKIKKLEADCQRLRSLTRKRMPYEVQGKNHMDGRKKSITGGGSAVKDSDDASKKLGFFIEQVQELEKENKILKECLAKSEEENKIVSYRSWDNEEKRDKVGDGRGEECKMFGASDMRLMDDFVEMEKLAIVAIDSSKEIVPFGNEVSECKLKDRSSDWLNNVVNAMLEQHGVSKRSLEDLLDDVRTALNSSVCPEPPKLLLTWKSPASTPRSEGSTNEVVSYNDHSIVVRDEFRKHLGGDGPGTAFELDCVQSLMLEMEKMFLILRSEIKGLKEEQNSVHFSAKDCALMHELLQSKETVASLRNELERLKESSRMTEDQIDNMKLMNEDLDTQLTVAKSRLHELLQKLSRVEVELDNKCHRCEELEGTCLDLQLQLESMSKRQCSEGNANREELLVTGIEITRASTKLAECEETILNLGKQLKAMGSARELSVMDKVLSITSATNKMFKQRASLRDQMLSEDSSGSMGMQQTESISKAIACTSISRTNSHDYFSFLDNDKAKKESKPGALVIIPSKNRGGGIGLLTKLLLRRKKSGCKSSATSLW